MKQPLIWLLLLTVFFIRCNDDGNDKPEEQPVDVRLEVKVLTFNIYNGGATLNNNYDMDKIAEVISRQNPDIVALQEVDFKTNRSGILDVATELGWRTDMAPVFGTSYNYDGGFTGVAILSRWSFLNSKVIFLPSSGEEKNSALIASVIISQSDTIALVSTQFAEDENTRNLQIDYLNQELAKISYPVILAGDFNAEPGSSSIDKLLTFWKPAYEQDKVRPTYPSSNPEQKLDYVMCRPANKWYPLFRMTIDDNEASDHCAYFTILGLE